VQHPDKKTCIILLEQIKHLKHTLETYMYSHYNCAISQFTLFLRHIPIYFCNIDIQRLQHISEILETNYCNMRFQCSICLLLGRMEACRRRARCHGMARRLPVWSSSAAQTSAGTGAGGCNAVAMGGANPGGGTRREQGGVADGRVRPRAKARSALSEQATYTGSVRTYGQPISSITDEFRPVQAPS
jgi:hypothetical protein